MKWALTARAISAHVRAAAQPSTSAPWSAPRTTSRRCGVVRGRARMEASLRRGGAIVSALPASIRVGAGASAVGGRAAPPPPPLGRGGPAGGARGGPRAGGPPAEGGPRAAEGGGVDPQPGG